VLTCLAALKERRQSGQPVVYEIRAFWEDAAVDHGTYRHGSVKYRLVRALETWACRKADQVVVICRGLKRDLESRGIDPGKIAVSPNGVDIHDFRPCEPDREYLQAWKLKGKTTIGFIGSFYRYEGLELLIDAFGELCRRHTGLMLLLAGGGNTEADLRIKALDMGLMEKVVMPGRIPHGRIPGVYALCDILAYPRYSMRLTDLVTPLKPLEAMAMSRPLVASDVGGHRELIRDGETALLFSPGNVGSLVEALEELILNRDLRAKLAAAGRAWVVRERTWDKTTAVYEDVYSRAMKSPHNRRGSAKLP